MKHIFPLGLLIAVSAASAATHSLVYLYTISLGDYLQVPEFVVVGSVDRTPHVHFDSNTMRLVPKADWMERFDAEYWDLQTMGLRYHHQTFKDNIKIAIQRFNHSTKTGVHTYQRMVGCEWDDETKATHGYDFVGYDGEDFLAFDLQSGVWNTKNPRAFITKLKWDRNRAENKMERQYLTNECVDWLKKYLVYGNSSLQRIAPPEVSVFHGSSSSPVTCHATGFYPSEVKMYWKKDGEDIRKGFSLGKILPNSDGTFQIRSTFFIAHEELKNHQFACVVVHHSQERDFAVESVDRPTMRLIVVAVGSLFVMIL